MAGRLIRLAVYGIVLLGMSMPFVAALTTAEAAEETVIESLLVAAEVVVERVDKPCCKHLQGVSIACFGDVTPADTGLVQCAQTAGLPPWPGEKTHLKTGDPMPMLRPPIS